MRGNFDRDDQNRERIESAYKQYRNLMYHEALKVLGNAEDAEDAVHEAFIYILKNPEKIRTGISPETQTYLCILARHRALNILRARENRRETDYDDSLGGVSEAPEEQEDGAFTDAMQELQLRYRDILLLRYERGYSVKQIAEAWGIRKETAQMILFRAKRSLKLQLDKKGVSGNEADK